jgi:hypothetical protein
LWRKLRLDWKYFVGELLIVTLGVFIALALDSWNDTRMELRLEDEILDRLISDIEADTTVFATWSERLEDKLAALDQVSATLSDPNSEIGDSLSFLRAIVVGSQYGWDQPGLSRTTFDELVSSGSLGLIGDPRMRRQLVDYYYLDEDSRGRMKPRRTEYPKVAYRLVSHVSEFMVPEDLDSGRLRRIVHQIRDSDLSDHIVAEINFGRFINEMILPLDSLARAVLTGLVSYRSAR